MSRCLTAFVAAATVALLAASCGSPSPTRPSDSRVSSPLSVVPPGTSSNTVSVEWRCVATAADRSFFGIFQSAQGACLTPASGRLSGSGLRAAAIPGPPIALSSEVSGSTVVLSWSASGAATSYVVEAGSSSGLSDLANIDTGSSAPTLTANGVPSGTYYVRVRGRNNEGVSGPSNETVVVVGGGGGCNSVPDPPIGLVATASGSTVSLSWAPGGGCPPQTYYIEAGSAPGRNDLADFSTGNPSTVFVAGGVGNGTYYVRVRAATSGGKSAPSNEATLVVGTVQAPCGAAPAAPSISYSIAGSSVTIVWATPAGSPASYSVEVGRSPGSSDLATTGTSSTAVTFAPGSGTFYARVRSVNGCGMSGPSNEITFSISGPTPSAPAAPRAIFTYTPTHPLANPVQCIVFPGGGGKLLRCTFNGSESTGNPPVTRWDWTIPTLGMSFSGAIVTDPFFGGCGSVPGVTTSEVTLTVTSSTGSHSTTKSISVVDGGPC